MFREFFCGAHWRTRLAAWVGLASVVGYAVFLAYVKREINSWYNRFYDTVASSDAAVLLLDDIAVAASNATDALGEAGSGAFFPAAPPAAPPAPTLAEYRALVREELWAFARIVAPLVLASPAAKWVRSAWALAWRMALMRAYLKAWDARQEPIEGASQRLHEDTQRFASALMGCLATVLDAVFTLVVFTPILLDLSARVAPPAGAGLARGAWLWLLAFGAALVGLGGAVVFGRHLVSLEVQNQLVEALLRKDLVLLEATPAVLVGQAAQPRAFAPWRFFGATLARLHRNYHALFAHFSMLNTWLSAHDQVMTLVPYVVAAPLLFAADPGRRITLGTLVQLSNSFDKVFASLSVVAENWGAVNEFRSVLVRLREFEARLYAADAPPRSASSSGGARDARLVVRCSNNDDDDDDGPGDGGVASDPGTAPRGGGRRGGGRRGGGGGGRRRRVVDDLRTARALMSLRRVERVVHRREGGVPTAPSAPDAAASAAASAAADVVRGDGAACDGDACDGAACDGAACEPTMARGAIELGAPGGARV